MVKGEIPQNTREQPLDLPVGLPGPVFPTLPPVLVHALAHGPLMVPPLPRGPWSPET